MQYWFNMFIPIVFTCFHENIHNGTNGTFAYVNFQVPRKCSIAMEFQQISIVANILTVARLKYYYVCT